MMGRKMPHNLNVGDHVTLQHEPFDGIYYVVVSVSEDRVELAAYSDESRTIRRPMADGFLVGQNAA